MMSLFLFLVGLVPLRSTPSSDGSRIAMLLWSRDRTRRWISTIALGGQRRDGIRLKDWKQSWLKAASSLHDDSVDEFSGNWVAYLSANDRKNTALAAVHLERCLQVAHLLRPSFRDMVAQEAAVFSAWFRRDALLAEKWITQIKRPKLLQPLVSIRMDLALRCARRDFASAADVWQRGFAFIEKLPATPTGARLRESWLEWQAEMKERQSEPVTA